MEFLSNTPFQNEDEFAKHFINSGLQDLEKFKRNFRARCTRYINSLDFINNEIEDLKFVNNNPPSDLLDDHVFTSKNLKSELIEYADRHRHLTNNDFTRLVGLNLDKMSLFIIGNYLNRLKQKLTPIAIGKPMDSFLRLLSAANQEFINYSQGAPYEIIIIDEIYRKNYSEGIVKEFTRKVRNNRKNTEFLDDIIEDIFLNGLGKLRIQLNFTRTLLKNKHKDYDDIAGTPHIITKFENGYSAGLNLVADQLYSVIKKYTDQDVPRISLFTEDKYSSRKHSRKVENTNSGSGPVDPSDNDGKKQQKLLDKVQAAFAFMKTEDERQHRQILSDDDFNKLINWVVYYFQNKLKLPTIQAPIKNVYTSKGNVVYTFKSLFKELCPNSSRPPSFYQLIKLCFTQYGNNTTETLRKTKKPQSYPGLNHY